MTLSNIEVIFEEIVNFFGKLYSKPEGASWRVEGVDCVPIPRESAVWLDKPFSEEEVRLIVFQLKPLVLMVLLLHYIKSVGM